MGIVGRRSHSFFGGRIDKIHRLNNTSSGNPSYQFIVEGHDYKTKTDAMFVHAVIPQQWQGMEAVFYVDGHRRIVGVESPQIEV